jgi:hypothetical protein
MLIRAGAVIALVLAASSSARADGPPPVLYIAQAVQAGPSPVDVGVVAADGTRRVLIDDAPSATWGLATHPATGRFALTFLQGSNGDPLVLDGAPVSKASDVAVLIYGDRDHGVTAHVAGDPKCTNRKTACFQSTLRFSDDGAVVFVQSEAARWSAVNRWLFGTTAAPALVADRAMASLQVSSDGAQVAVVQPRGIAVSAWPTQPTDPRRKVARVKAGKIAVAPKLLMSDAWLIGGKLFYFRREPVAQKRGALEAYDLATRRATELFALPDEFPMWRHEFFFSAARKSVVFATDVGFERATLREAALADLQPRAVVADAHALLDVSASGRYALMSAYTDAGRGNMPDNPEQLWIVDLSTDRVTKLDVGVVGARVLAARFIAP